MMDGDTPPFEEIITGTSTSSGPTTEKKYVRWAETKAWFRGPVTETEPSTRGTGWEVTEAVAEDTPFARVLLTSGVPDTVVPVSSAFPTKRVMTPVAVSGKTRPRCCWWTARVLRTEPLRQVSKS